MSRSPIARPLFLASVLFAAGCATGDYEQNYIDAFATGQASDGQVELELVRAAGDGVIELYDGNGPEFGALLDRERVFAGANADIRLDAPITEASVLAVLRVGGEVVATRRITLSDSDRIGLF